MNSLFSSNQIVEMVREAGEDWEVFATAEATYEQESSRLEIELDVYLRATLGPLEDIRRAAWLPKRNHIVEHAARSEATKVAHEVFAHWVRTIRKNIPANQIISSARPVQLRLDHHGFVHI